MSAYLFAAAIMDGKPIQVFNHGDMQRDFTYVDDIVEGTLRVLDKPARYAVYNIGNHTPVPLLDYIATLERALGRKAQLEMQPMQPGDVKATYADTNALAKAVGFAPSTPLEVGLARFAEWFKSWRADPRSRA
jgi:UDP-glucuronate 4-epimerase